MKGTHLGEFEELVLLTVGILQSQAYAIKIVEEMEAQTGRRSSLSPIHSALYRLEKKGFVKSILGGATTTRGGRRKRIYDLTQAGRAALDRSREMRNQLWDLLPEI